MEKRIQNQINIPTVDGVHSCTEFTNCEVWRDTVATLIYVESTFLVNTTTVHTDWTVSQSHLLEIRRAWVTRNKIQTNLNSPFASGAGGWRPPFSNFSYCSSSATTAEPRTEVGSRYLTDMYTNSSIFSLYRRKTLIFNDFEYSHGVVCYSTGFPVTSRGPRVSYRSFSLCFIDFSYVFHEI